MKRIALLVVITALSMCICPTIVWGNNGDAATTTGTIKFLAPTISGVDPDPTDPLNPSDPDTPIDPNDSSQPKPEQNAGGKGFLRIDYAPKYFDFGAQPLPTVATTLYAKPLLVMSEDGSRTEEWINYVQISDKRGTYGGWSLTVTQNEQFKSASGDKHNELVGAELSLGTTEAPAEVLGANVASMYQPSFVRASTKLIPGEAQSLLTAYEGEGLATWVYRFGNDDTKEKAISLMIPAGQYVEGIYKSTLTWTLSDVPLVN
ncbi:WxL domain-containing protein [Erwinia sp. CPCC 100877]|nr:WxL domain-containing protein [Erwinia sp. CPCC 100877]